MSYKVIIKREIGWSIHGVECRRRESLSERLTLNGEMNGITGEIMQDLIHMLVNALTSRNIIMDQIYIHFFVLK